MGDCSLPWSVLPELGAGAEGWTIFAGVVVPGALQTDGRVIHADGHVTNGPLVDRDDVARGYLKIKAESLDTAVEHVRGCPVLLHDGRVEVRPFFDEHRGEWVGVADYLDLRAQAHIGDTQQPRGGRAGCAGDQL